MCVCGGGASSVYISQIVMMQNTIQGSSFMCRFSGGLTSYLYQTHSQSQVIILSSSSHDESDPAAITVPVEVSILS